MTLMLVFERYFFLIVHTSIHVIVYLILQTLCQLLHFPVALWGWCRKVFGWDKRVPSEIFRSYTNAREIRVIFSQSSDLLYRCGLEKMLSTPYQQIAINAPTLGNSNNEDTGSHDVKLVTLRSAYRAPLYNCHVNTLLSVFQPIYPSLQKKREVIYSFDQNRICLDWFLPRRTAEKKVLGLVLLLPGLTGNSDAFYIQRVARLLLLQNVAVVVLNARGVAGTPLDKPQFYSALFTEDLRFVLNENNLTRRLKGSSSEEVPIIACGFSMGGLVLANYLIEQSSSNKPSKLIAGITINSPLHIPTLIHAINDHWIPHLLYNLPLAVLLRETIKPHLHVLQRMKGVDVESVFVGTKNKKPLLNKVSSIKGFDEIITAPHFGFPDADTYYERASVIDRLHLSQTPVICISAFDDPVTGTPVVDEYAKLAAKHKNGLLYIELPCGGHIGYTMGPLDNFNAVPNPIESLFSGIVHHLLAFGSRD